MTDKALNQQLQGLQHTGHGNHPNSSGQLSNPHQSEKDRVHRQSRCMVDSDLRVSQQRHLATLHYESPGCLEGEDSADAPETR